MHGSTSYHRDCDANLILHQLILHRMLLRCTWKLKLQLYSFGTTIEHVMWHEVFHLIFFFFVDTAVECALACHLTGKQTLCICRSHRSELRDTTAAWLDSWLRDSGPKCTRRLRTGTCCDTDAHAIAVLQHVACMVPRVDASARNAIQSRRLLCHAGRIALCTKDRL